MKRPKMQYFFDILRWRFFLRFLTIFGAFGGGKIWTHWKDGACVARRDSSWHHPYFAREVTEQTSPDQLATYSKRDAWACLSTPIDIYPLKSLHMFRLHPVNLMYRVFTIFLCQWLSCSSSTYNSKLLQRLSSRKKILNLWRSFSRLVRPPPAVMGLWSSVSCWHKNLHFIAGLSLPSCFISI